jgi:hypothetical protein
LFLGVTSLPNDHLGTQKHTAFAALHILLQGSSEFYTTFLKEEEESDINTLLQAKQNITSSKQRHALTSQKHTFRIAKSFPE